MTAMALIRKTIAIPLYLTCSALDLIPSVEKDQWGYRHFQQHGSWGCKLRVSRVAVKFEGA